MKRLSLLDLPILLLLGALVFAIGCPDETATTSTPPAASVAIINGPTAGTVNMPVTFTTSNSTGLAGASTVWTVKNAAGTSVSNTPSGTNNNTCTFTPAAIGSYTIEATVGATVAKEKTLTVSALPAPPKVTLNAESLIIATTEPRTFTIPSIDYAVSPSTATKSWSIASTTCVPAPTITSLGQVTLPTVFGTDCKATVELKATNAYGTGKDTVSVIIKAKPVTGITGGGGGSL